jgi:flagella basal body P-ring formation protein FlgA
MSVRRWMASRALVGRSPTRASVVVATLLGAWVLAAGSGRAALFRLRTECRSRGPVVTLGDVAEIVAADPQQADVMAALELFPAPSSPQQRFVRLREIQDLLLLRGVNLAEHQFSGSSQVTVLAPDMPAESKPEPRLSPAAAATANRRVVDAVVQYLRQQVSTDVPWTVEVELDPSHARLVADSGRAISVIGGAPPWTGLQRFELTIDAPEGATRLPLEIQVGISPAVVVAARSLPRGTVIHAADVELQHGAAPDQRSDVFDSIDKVVGRETTRAIPKGKAFQQESVRSPLLVRRGDAVTVYARNSGICVRTLGRARDDGSLGELVAVESLEDRSTYFARVSNVREVEVYARTAQADRVEISGLPSEARCYATRPKTRRVIEGTSLPRRGADGARREIESAPLPVRGLDEERN